jgi:hypothetical protein
MLSILCVVSLRVQKASAATYNDYNYLMDDSVFQSTGTMSVAQIQAFLVNEGSGLASFSDVENCNNTTVPSDDSAAYSCNSTQSAAQIIYSAAQNYGINPEIVLATLQKEQSLITTPNPTASQLSYAMSYGCPDSGGCYDPGFFAQIDNATWQFRYDLDALNGQSYQGYTASQYPCGTSTHAPPYSSPNSIYYYPGLNIGNNVTFYDGNGTAYASFTIPNASTAALYCYTPHVYNNPNGLYGNPQSGTTGLYYSGSYSFEYYFNLWFVPYNVTYYAQSSYPVLNPGQSANVWFEYQNTGYETWYDDDSISSAPSGSYPIHLATNHTINRLSAFGSTWPSYSRAATVFSAVYNSNGTTLASNQHEALPGQIVKFSFTMTSPLELAPATYPEYFIPVAEGTPTGSFNDPGTAMMVTVNAVPNISWLSQSGYPTIYPDTSSAAYLMLTNTGNTVLYDDDSISSAPSGSYPVHLATSNPLNSSSLFSSSWPSSTRVANIFSAVYNSNGTTLASNQHEALPGQVIEFSFNFSVASQYSSGAYTQYLQPILEGTPSGYFNNLGISWTITVPSSPVISVTNTTPNTALASGQNGQIVETIANVGNSGTDSNAFLSTGSASSLAATNWTSSSVIQTLPQALSPGQSVNLTIPLLAPTTTSNISATLGCVFVDNSTTLPTTSTCSTSIPISAASYNASFVTGSSPFSLAINQVSTASLSYKNTGNQIWYDDDSISSATTRSPLPMHLATAQSLNRSSGFDLGWVNAARPATTFSAVYNSDGVTLTSNQHEALPGQIVTFNFSVSPQSWVPVGSYSEYFQPIIEGTSSGAVNNQNSYITINVLPTIYSASFFAQSNYPVLNPGQSANVWFEYQNTGNQTWYDDTSISAAPTGSYPVHLATNHTLNRLSAFGATWPSYSRAATVFSAVYNSSGTTPASNQHEALPGQIVKFSFTMSVPTGLTPATYPEYFIPVAEGTTTGSFNDPGTAMMVTVQ